MKYEAQYDGSWYVELSSFERSMAWYRGSTMWLKSRLEGRKDRHPSLGMRNHIQGMLAEQAAAKALGIYWPMDIDTFHKPDLGHNIEVKMIGADWYGLRIYPWTPDDRRVVAVVLSSGGEQGPYRIPGWYIAGEAKQHPEWVIAPNDRPPMWAVPQHELRLIETLYCEITTDRMYLEEKVP